MIPREKIEEVRERADIVEVVSEYVPLKRRGRNHVGLCPFHSEKTPSFTVSEEKNIFYCFGCHTGGSAITFLMKHEGMSFPEAVRSLARRYGIHIQEERTDRRGGGGERERIYRLNQAACDFFVETLGSTPGARARHYLKKRGYDGEIASRFKLGYAPMRSDGLVVYLRDRGLDLDLAVKAGLVGKADNRYYDRFRERIIFPIIDIRGRVVGFGGRSIDAAEPKYLNSPETAVFRKSEVLYGLYQAKGAISKAGYVILVEGYFDLIALHRSGLTNSVATMGTALTPGHVRILKRYAGSVCMLFDADEAGRKAALRGLDLALSEEMPTRVVVLPDGCDPDDFLKREGRERLEEEIRGAEPIMEFFLKELKRVHDTGSADGKAAYLDEAVPRLVRIRNAASREHYVAMVASVLGVDARAVYEAMNLASSQGSTPSRILKGVLRPDGSRLAESMVLKVILRHPELYSERVKEAFALFRTPLLKEVARVVASLYEDGVTEPEKVFDRVYDEDVRGFVAETIFSDEKGFMESPERMLDDCTRKILEAGRPRRATVEMLRRLEESGHEDLVRKILGKMGPEGER